MQKTEKKVLTNKYLLIATNILLVIFTAIGLWLMFSRRSAASPSEFLAKGLKNFYGFLKWRYPIGILAFILILLSGWGIACLLRFIRKLSSSNQYL